MPVAAESLAISNRLLAALPLEDRKRVVTACEQVELRYADVLCKPGGHIRHVYFPADSFFSLVAVADGRATLEVGLIGNEGMLGIPLILGIDISPHRALVGGSGKALRMGVATFQRELGNSRAMQRGLNRYLYALMAQFGQTAACTRFHLLGARLARWLLMTRDRAHSDTFHFTHDFLAEMLGVRRVGVTKAAGMLQRRGLISYRRGHIRILDPEGLKGVSCSCYQAMKQTYERILR